MADKDPMAPCADAEPTDAENEAIGDEALVFGRLLLAGRASGRNPTSSVNSRWARAISNTVTGSNAGSSSSTGPASRYGAVRS